MFSFLITNSAFASISLLLFTAASQATSISANHNTLKAQRQPVTWYNPTTLPYEKPRRHPGHAYQYCAYDPTRQAWGIYSKMGRYSSKCSAKHGEKCILYNTQEECEIALYSDIDVALEQVLVNHGIASYINEVDSDGYRISAKIKEPKSHAACVNVPATNVNPEEYRDMYVLAVYDHRDDSVNCVSDPEGSGKCYYSNLEFCEKLFLTFRRNVWLECNNGDSNNAQHWCYQAKDYLKNN